MTNVTRFMPNLSYKHFNSDIKAFNDEIKNLSILSVNNSYVAPESFNKDFRMTRFIRDPRDLIVSGYHYHKRGAEKWCNQIGPDAVKTINGKYPMNCDHSLSFSENLNRMNLTEGLIAEIDLRENHLKSMMDWDLEDERVRLIYYDDIIGNEINAFKEIFNHYEFNILEKTLGYIFVDRFSLKNVNQKKLKHIRNPNSGQWKEFFPEEVVDYFNERYRNIIDKYNFS